MVDLLEQVAINDLRGESRYLAEVIGLDGFKNLVREFGGTSRLYVPTLDTVVLPVRDELIRREYDGTNAMELARKWNLTERWIYEIVKDIRARPIDGQISLFDG